ncbi:MAG TPA: shikimate dehydrogenase, partial [Verrucomicrobiales bacterium]|nr:shikimate dehydrogenase [Verrucomicrobiales bacterium]
RSGSGGWQPVATFDNDLPAEVRSVGFNTDADAIIRSIREDLGLELQGKRVALLGAGGAGRAAALRIADEQPSELFLINRTRSKAEALADEIKSTYPQLHVATDPPVSRLDLLVNATSLGLRTDDPLPLNSDWLRAHVPGAVYDMIYRPAQTSLLKLAGELNCRTANGIGMLLHQGADALQLWTGQPAPRSIMRHALEEHIYG